MTAGIAIVAAFALPASASAADTYANADSGSDSNDCLTPSTPCLTVTAALSKSGAGDTTFLDGIIFGESVTLDQGKSLTSVPAPVNGPPIVSAVGGVGSGVGITIDTSGAGTVSGVVVLGDSTAMQVNGAVTIDNDIFGAGDGSSPGSDVNVQTDDPVVITNSQFYAPTSGPTAGIRVDSPAASVVIAHNTIGQIDLGNGVLAAGVNVLDGGAELRRNEILGTDVAVRVTDSPLPVTLSNDLIHDNTVGLQATDTSGDTPPNTQGDVSTTNETIFDSTDADVRLDHTTLTMDSSIVGTPVDLVGAGACDISFSRGPSSSVGSGCDDFDTSADPQFVDAPGGDFHLQASSPLIDVGNPADPGTGALDFYGDPRAVLGKACSTVRRDIGAAEYNPGSAPLCPQDTYADATGGDDANDCITPATACQTIAAALAKMTSGHTTLIADGTYAETLTLDGGKSLVSLDPTNPRPLIDGGGAPAITVDASGAGSISGLHLLSDAAPSLIDVNGAVEISDSLFDEDNLQTFSADVVTQPGATGVVVHDNVFDDPDASGGQIGVILADDDSPAPVVSDNTFADLAAGVVVINGDPQISDNQLTGMYPIGSTPLSDLPGAGVLVITGTPVIIDNTIGEPSGHPSAGVYIKKVPADHPTTAGATLVRNRITGNDAGVQIVDTNAPVSLTNDLIYGNTTGIESTDSSADSPPSTQGDVSATNETIFDNAVDASVSYTTLTLDSSILGTPIDVVGNNGACDITYSRGSSAASSNGCGNFDTNADPQFVDSASGNFHLQSTSPLIDVGDPASPGPGAVDFYGGPRELQGKACSTVRRDIGAAEYDPGTTPVCPPLPQPTPSPTPTPETTPAAKIDIRPEKRSEDTSPTFKFSSDVAGATFLCKLDKKSFKRCVSPKTYHGLKVGKHSFKVYALSPTGQRGKAQAFEFKVIEPN